MLAYFGHHKCASRWTLGVLRSICHDLGLRFHVVREAERDGATINARVRDEGIDLVAEGTCNPQFARDLDFERAFHVIRDPRDIVVSSYFSHRYSHSTEHWPVIEEYRAALERLDEHDGLMYVIEHRGRQFTQMAEWDYGRDDVLEVKFEDLVRNPFGTLTDVTEFLGLLDTREAGAPARLAEGARATARAVEARLIGARRVLPAPRRLSVERLARIVHHHDFKRKAQGRKVGEEDVRSHYRKGVPGDWRHHLTVAHLERMTELYGDLVARLGYDTTLQPIPAAGA